MTEATTGPRDPDQYVPCPRHGTHCFREIPDLAQRIECAIGLGGGGAAGVKATADRIMTMVEDHVLAELADVDEELNEARLHNDATCGAVADRDRLHAENRLLKALLHIPTGSCHRTAVHPPHRWLTSRTTQHCPGFGPGSGPAEDRAEVTYELGFQCMDRPYDTPGMVGRPVADILAVMADKRATFPEARFALRRRIVGPWVTVEDRVPDGD
jgi:hypothetical protein